MNINIFLACIGLFLSLTTAILSMICISLFKKLNTLIQEEKHLKSEKQEKFHTIIIHAERSAKTIIEEAQIKSHDIISKATALDTHITNVFEANLAESSTKQIQSLEKITQEQINDFQKLIQQQTISSQKIIEDKMQTAYKQVEEEIEGYKKEKYASINDHIYTVLNFVSKQILGKTLSLEQHQELVLEELTKALREKSMP